MTSVLLREERVILELACIGAVAQGARTIDAVYVMIGATVRREEVQHAVDKLVNTGALLFTNYKLEGPALWLKSERQFE